MKSLLGFRKGAVELSVGTIVILVIGMTMLVLGIVLVRTIFTGATDSVDLIDEGVKQEINKLFAENDKKVVVKLPNNKAEITKGKDFGVAFGVRNTEQGGTGAAQRFNYKVEATGIPSGCQVTKQEAERYIILGQAGNLTIVPGSEPEAEIIRFRPSDASPLCNLRYTITVTKQDNSFYDSERFDIEIVGK